MSTDDDDALSWAGDESVAAPVTSERGGRTPRRLRQDEQDAASDADDARATDDDALDGQTGSVALVLLGLLGGVHLLYSVGWVLAIGPLQAGYRPIDALGSAMFSLGLVFAAAAPLVWFAAAFWFTRGRFVWQRIAALVAGAVLLVPWPFVAGVQ